jgi:medium-chain acyl-[acyl-carrier-protein] hydrolase
MNNTAIQITAPSSHARVRLFCLPHAGAGASVYQSWGRQLPNDIEVCAVQPPGRESRFNEPLSRDMASLAGSVANSMLPYLDRPAALFGHSMGALLAFAVLRHLQASHGIAPVHLFVSSHRAPHLPSRRQPLHRLSDAELLGELRVMNGARGKHLEDEELTKLMLPIVRADLELCETYRHGSPNPVDVPITAIGGTRDPLVSVEELAAWREHTRARFHVQVLSGDHFYARSNPGALLSLLSRQMAPRRETCSL